jgi:signal transduction histidine kinase
VLEIQLKEACKTTQARWAIWVHREEMVWLLGANHGLNKTRITALEGFIQQTQQKDWFSGAFTSGRVRSCKTGIQASKLLCQRLYLFPDIQSYSGILVGADQLDKSAENLFKILSICPPPAAQAENSQNFFQSAIPHISSSGAPLELSYDPEGILSNILEFLANSITCDAALLSVRSGDIFRVEAVWNCPPDVFRRDLSISDNHLLHQMTTTYKGLVINKFSEQVDNLLSLGFGEELGQRARAWAGVPIIIGRRVIGHLAFLRLVKRRFSLAELQKTTEKVSRIAFVVENAIVFTEAARYLQQLALLNELASAASAGLDTHEAADRVMQRLRRTFNTEQAGVFLLSSDGKTFREYGSPATLNENEISIPADQQLMEQVILYGVPRRLNEEIDSINHPESTQIRSKLAVPLKYRGKIIGAIALGSQGANIFSQQDEQLLVVIASHLAGLFENVRLNEETRQRAHNLNLIHQVVQKVVGSNNLTEIVKVSAELMVKNFSYEMAAVILQHEKVSSVVIHVPQGIQTINHPEANETLSFSGITAKVLEDGQSRLVNDLDCEQPETLSQGWVAGSLMCVPIKEGEHSFGVIQVGRARKNAFTENDQLALEALAGFLSSVVLSARRYRQLQDSVRQLQAVRDTALDIAGNLDLDALLKRIVQRARELIGARGAKLGLLDEKDQLVRILVSDTPWTDTIGEQIPLLAGVEGRVAAFGEPLVVQNYKSWNGRLYPEREAPFKSIAGVPLMFQRQVIGTLTVLDDRQDWVFTPEHIQLLELLAPQASAWIRNARLYQELEERIQAQRMAENRLIRSARLAAVGEMAAGVAHELNNPLTTIAGFVELILSELELEPPYHQDLELVLRESLRARSVVRRLLDFSRPGENLRSRTNLNELVADVVSLVHHLARTGGVEIRLDLNSDLPLVSIDPSQIKQVLLNLIHNAINAMHAGGHMELSSYRKTTHQEGEETEWVVISVKDSGEGIAPQNLERIFEPFFTTRPAGKGTGLGLSVSYGIISEHSGIIEVESVLGQGSCFSIFLPVARAAIYD